MQKEWIQNQIKLIEEQETKGRLARDNDDLLTKKSILDKKKLRLNSEVEAHNKAIRELEVALKNQTFEMNKLNDAFYSNTNHQDQHLVTIPGWTTSNLKVRKSLSLLAAAAAGD